jgi:predicted nucleic-acid-binding Zn-ribbon protein
MNKDDNNKNNSSSNGKCPRCKPGYMIIHPSLLSMPLSSAPQAIAEIKEDKQPPTTRISTTIKDQDANFVFRFSSCKNCGYSEFYLTNDKVTKGI